MLSKRNFCATEARLFAFAEGVDIASVTQQRMKEVTNLRQGNFLARWSRSPLSP
jgi:hypothetical protein